MVVCCVSAHPHHLTTWRRASRCGMARAMLMTLLEKEGQYEVDQTFNVLCVAVLGGCMRKRFYAAYRPDVLDAEAAERRAAAATAGRGCAGRAEGSRAHARDADEVRRCDRARPCAREQRRQRECEADVRSRDQARQE